MFGRSALKLYGSMKHMVDTVVSVVVDGRTDRWMGHVEASCLNRLDCNTSWSNQTRPSHHQFDAGTPHIETQPVDHT